MSNNPPLFKNFGKNFKDLVEKKFDFTREARIKTTTSTGVTFETLARTNNKSADYTGGVKVTFKRPTYGNFEGEVDTDGKLKYSVENDQLAKGVVVKVNGDHAPSLGLDVGYRREHVSVSAGVNNSPKTTSLDLSGAVGYEGLFVGGSTKYDVKTQQINDYNTGAEYAQPDYTITVKTSDRLEKVAASYFHSVNPDVTVGGSFAYNIANPKRLDNIVSLVGSYTLERDTTLKGKFSSDLVLATALEQRLFNPRVKYGLSFEHNLKNQTATPERFGLSLCFGEF